MQENIKIYKENYENLPCRFVEKIEHDVQYILNADIPDLKKIYLFGSCARGEVRSSSDVDLLLLTAHKINDRVLAADIRWTLDEPIKGIRTDIVFQNEESEKTKNVFENVVNRDKKVILEVIR
ncbi:nucleotidyltransferase domain-containing protein [Bariatricus sp. SGI.154]|uniref:nucleotidyltransferase domain-containing protein n=1 Tax=Bariatricus sp. SGI.154 TaxID=3420549 RepID=UPI003D00D715